MTVQVPCENADQVGLRRVIGEKEVAVVLKALTGGSTEMPKNWNRRFKHKPRQVKRATSSSWPRSYATSLCATTRRVCRRARSRCS